MKKLILSIVLTTSLAIYSCKKESSPESEPVKPVNTDNYLSAADFYLKNGVPLQTFTINGSTGGSFISTQGTTVNIPANAFANGGEIMTVEFKDIYKKSDMLFSNMPTQTIYNLPLKSAGEFFLKVSNSSNIPVALAPAKAITVLQPFIDPMDKDMNGFVMLKDTFLGGNGGWSSNPSYTLIANAASYVFSFYSFGYPLSNGTWCNSDNSSYFGSFTQTTLTIQPNQSGQYTDIFLVFKNISSMVHVYKWGGSDFVYTFAPVGLECTIVALDVRDGKLFSAFTPITISPNLKIKFDLKETTTEIFKAAVKALD